MVKQFNSKVMKKADWYEENQPWPHIAQMMVPRKAEECKGKTQFLRATVSHRSNPQPRRSNHICNFNTYCQSLTSNEEVWLNFWRQSFITWKAPWLIWIHLVNVFPSASELKNVVYCCWTLCSTVRKRSWWDDTKSSLSFHCSHSQVFLFNRSLRKPCALLTTTKKTKTNLVFKNLIHSQQQ